MGTTFSIKLKKKRGFTLVEMLFALMITSLTLSLLAQGCVALNRLKKTADQNEDITLFAYQLQHELMSAKNIQLVNDDSLSYELNDQCFTISLDQRRIVKKEGFEILLFDCDQIYFKMNDLIEIQINRKGKTYTKIIGIKRLKYD